MTAAPYYALLAAALVLFVAATGYTHPRHRVGCVEALSWGVVIVGAIAAVFVWAAMRE